MITIDTVFHRVLLGFLGYLLKVGQFKVNPFAERSRSGPFASTGASAFISPLPKGEGADV